MSDYPQTLSDFERIVRGKAAGETMAALIIDSPWLPGYAGVNTLDFYFDMRVWLDAYRKVRAGGVGRVRHGGGTQRLGRADPVDAGFSSGSASLSRHTGRAA